MDILSLCLSLFDILILAFQMRKVEYHWGINIYKSRHQTQM